MEQLVKSYLKETLEEVAAALETGSFGQRKRIGVTTLGSELGESEIVRGAELASKRNSHVEVVVIGNNITTDLEVVRAENEEQAHQIMDQMLESGELDGCVTMHYNFPIGVSTVGRVISPGKGRKLFIANTTGTSATSRIAAMVKNTISGIGVAKACGVKNPTVGILNIEGARAVERALKKIEAGGYDINFTESARSDGGVIMRGNDLLLGAANVMTVDSLTGNVLMKVFSAFNSGGDYEALGYGYGPGVGYGYDRIICILSRASGANVVAGAIGYAAVCAEGNLTAVIDDEFEKAKMAGLDKVLKAIEEKEVSGKDEDDDEEIKAPPSKPTTADIPGIEILDLEDAVQALWKENIYATSGMGCTGPIVMVAEEDLDIAKKILQEKDYV